MRFRIAPVGWSIALHAALAGLLYLGITLRTQEPRETMLPIDAAVVDEAVLEAAGRKSVERERPALEEQRRLEAEAEAERLEQQRLEQERQQERERQEEQRRLEEEQQARAEADAEARRRAEEEAQRQAEQEAKQRAEAEARRKAEQEAQAERERAQREARLRAEREADLRERLAAEEARSSPGYQSLRASYVAAIQAHVERRWYEPPGTTEGLVCRIFVMQIPGGEVVGTRFGSCNGNAAVRQSIETAVRNSSPLPAPQDPSLFEREVELVFTPKETRN